MITSEMSIQKFKDDYGFRLAPETVDLYQKAVGQLLTYCEKSLDQITRRDIRNWMIHLERNDYAPTTIRTKLFGVKLFFQYCLEEEILSHNPLNSLPLPEVEESLPRYLQSNQLTQLRQLVKGRVQEIALIELLYATGVRIRELSSMKKEDINWSERIIHIPSGKRKKARIVLFTRECAEHLQAYLQNRQDDLPFVFVNTTGTGPVCHRTVQKKFKMYTKQLGSRLTPHTLRHTFAAHLAIKGMPLACIQVLLGHDSPHQTHLYARLYNHARKQMYDEFM